MELSLVRRAEPKLAQLFSIACDAFSDVQGITILLHLTVRITE